MLQYLLGDTPELWVSESHPLALKLLDQGDYDVRLLVAPFSKTMPRDGD